MDSIIDGFFGYVAALRGNRWFPVERQINAALARCAVTIDGKYTQFEAPQSCTGDNEHAATWRFTDQWSHGEKLQPTAFQSWPLFAASAFALATPVSSFAICCSMDTLEGRQRWKKSFQTPFKFYSIPIIVNKYLPDYFLCFKGFGCIRGSKNWK